MRGLLAAATALALIGTAAAADAPKVAIQKLGTLTTTVTGQKIVVPPNADFIASIGTFPPGAKLPEHKHPYPHLVYVLEGVLTLVEDDGETLLRAGDCAAFPKGTGNGHHLKNLSPGMAVYLEVGSRSSNDLTTCSDIDMMSSSADGRFVHKDGSPYP